MDRIVIINYYYMVFDLRWQQLRVAKGMSPSSLSVDRGLMVLAHLQMRHACENIESFNSHILHVID